ncbi:MAG: YIP1 family protein [Candidatus Margulisiibacteriota bacterium]
MSKTLKEYFITWWTIMARPILFFTRLKEEDWKEKALTFLLQTAWLLAALVALTIFIVQYVPIGATLVEAVRGWKLIVVLPVLVTLALVFFLITAFILGGLLVVGLGAAFYGIGAVLHYTYILMGGKGHLPRMIQQSLYSSAVTLAGVIPCLLAVFTRYGLLDFALFRVGYNLFYGLTVLYVYGLWAVSGRRVYGVPKWLAFTGALVPVIILLIFGLAFDKIALGKLEAWIAPLK